MSQHDTKHTATLEARLQELEAENTRLREVLHENMESVKMLLGKDQELIETNVQLEERTHELNEIGKVLVNRDRELTNSNERLRELGDLKTQFVSVAAHQLRTPMTGIRWTMETLLSEDEGALTEEQKEMLKEASDATVRLVKLVNDLLNVSRLEEGRFGFNFKVQSLMPIIESAYERFGSIAETRQVSLSLKEPEISVPDVSLDKDRIEIVFDNMLENAIKYSKEGGMVTLSVSSEKGNVVVSVSDTGIGIPEKQKHHIFKRFYRARNAQLHDTHGTGLGLYLSKNIVAEHGGTMDLESEEDKGTTVHVALPVPADV